MYVHTYACLQYIYQNVYVHKPPYTICIYLPVFSVYVYFLFEIYLTAGSNQSRNNAV